MPRAARVARAAPVAAREAPEAPAAVQPREAAKTSEALQEVLEPAELTAVTTSRGIRRAAIAAPHPGVPLPAMLVWACSA